jgi:hypothetical protein
MASVTQRAARATQNSGMRRRGILSQSYFAQKCDGQQASHSSCDSDTSQSQRINSSPVGTPDSHDSSCAVESCSDSFFDNLLNQVRRPVEAGRAGIDIRPVSGQI